jgi:hypothetical protein
MKIPAVCCRKPERKAKVFNLGMKIEIGPISENEVAPIMGRHIVKGNDLLTFKPSTKTSCREILGQT